MTRVLGLVSLAISSIAVAFAVPPAKNAAIHKPTTASSRAVKSTGSSHALAHHGGIVAAKAPAKSSLQLKAVSTRSASLRTARGRTLNSKTVQGRRLVARAAAPSFQTHPDEDRYRQIQQSLADKGYFKGEVNGEWGPDSMEALQKFQLDNKLPDIYSDGKINSLSLIGLGLGPKHGARTDEAVPTPPIPPPPATLAPSDNSPASTSPPQQSN